MSAVLDKATQLLRWDEFADADSHVHWESLEHPNEAWCGAPLMGIIYPDSEPVTCPQCLALDPSGAELA